VLLIQVSKFVRPVCLLCSWFEMFSQHGVCTVHSSIASAVHVRCFRRCNGVCGGSDCDKRFNGSAPSCCQSEIRVANKPCGTAPCMITPTSGGGGGTTCKIPCGHETVYGKPFEQGSTPDTQCCKGAEGCYSIDYNGRGTKCQITVTCNKQVRPRLLLMLLVLQYAAARSH
jgi:hypothetical protein